MTVSLVTGGGRGIGRAIAQALGGKETTVAIAGRTRSQLESTALELEAAGARPIPLEMDVTSEQSVARAIDTLRAGIAHVDVLVNRVRRISRRTHSDLCKFTRNSTA